MTGASEPDFHLCPALVLHAAATSLFTPFSLVPQSIANQSVKLLTLCAVPLYRFRFFGPRFSQTGLTYPLDLIYVNGDQIIGPWHRMAGRPVVLWSDEPDALRVARAVVSMGATFMLFVSSEPVLVDQFRQDRDLSERGLAVQAAEPGASSVVPDLSARMWAAYLELIEKIFEAAGQVAPNIGSGWPTHKESCSMAEARQLAQVGAMTHASVAVVDQAINGDLMLMPNRVLLSFALQRLPRYNVGEPASSNAPAESVMVARTMMALRGLATLAEMRATVPSDDPQLLAAVRRIGGQEAVDVLEAMDAFDRGELHDARFMEVFAKPPDAIANFAPHQLILVSPSASLARVAGGADVTSAFGLRVVGRHGSTALDELIEREPAYNAHVVDQIARGGRRLGVESPTNPDQQRIVAVWLHGLRQESEHLSAIALAYASRFVCPVFKNERTGHSIRERLLHINSIFDEMETSAGQLLASAADATKLASGLGELTAETTGTIAPEYLQYVDSRADPMIHTFSDFPLEFAQCGEDWLGYRAEISRTPNTPGDLAVLNYTQTELTTRLPTRPDEFLLVTPFQQNQIVETALSGLQHVPEIRRQVIHRASDMIDKLDDERIGCLVFFGHGYYDAARDQSALVLSDQYLYATDITRARRIPPLVVLIGCNTAAASSLLGALHTALFRAGAQLIVGTSFPVPLVSGAQFLGLFISNLLSPSVSLEGGRSRPLRDLAEVVAVVRRRMRAMSDLFSLLEQGRISEATYTEAVDTFLQRLGALTLDQMAHDEVQLVILRELLAELHVIDDKNVSPLEWNIVPYPLFFSLLGFPWTNRSARWLSTSRTS